MSILQHTSKQQSTLTQPNLVSTKGTGFQQLQRQSPFLAAHQSNMAKGHALALRPSTWRGLGRVLDLYYVNVRVEIRSPLQVGFPVPAAALRRRSLYQACVSPCFLFTFVFR